MKTMVRVGMAAIFVGFVATSTARAQLFVQGNVATSVAPYRDYDQLYERDERTLSGFGSASVAAELRTPISRATASGTIFSEAGRLGIDFAGGTSLMPTENPKAHTDASTRTAITYSDTLSLFSPAFCVGEWMNLTFRARASGMILERYRGANRDEQTTIGLAASFKMSFVGGGEMTSLWRETSFPDGTAEGEMLLHVRVRNDPAEIYLLELNVNATAYARSYIYGMAFNELITEYSTLSAISLAWGGVVSAESQSGDPIEGLVVSTMSGIDYSKSYAELPPFSSVPEPAAYGWIGALLLIVPSVCRMIRNGSRRKNCLNESKWFGRLGSELNPLITRA